MSKPDRAEDAAFFYVPAILGVELKPWDHSGRQRAVDARLHYPDGRIAALEVTSAAGDGRRQLYALLEANQTLPNPGNWTWSATIDDPQDFPELLERVERLVLKSEAKGLRQPEYAYDDAFGGDEDFAWLVRSSVKLLTNRGATSKRFASGGGLCHFAASRSRSTRHERTSRGRR